MSSSIWRSILLFIVLISLVFVLGLAFFPGH